MNKRFSIRLGLVVMAILAVIIIVIIYIRPDTKEVGQKVIVPSVFSSSVEYNSSKILLTNGRALVTYDYTSGTSQELSPEDNSNTLQSLDSLSTSRDGKYILFHIEQALAGSNLEVALTQHSLTNDTDYWWVFNTTTKTYTPLPKGTILAKFIDDKIGTVSTSDAGEIITIYNLTSLSPQNKFSIPGSTDFWAYDDGYLLQLADGSISFTKDGKVTEELFGKMNIITILPDQGKGVGTVNSDDDTRLIALDLAKKKQKIINSAITASPVASKTGDVLYITTKESKDDTNNRYQDYNLMTGKTTKWSLTKSLGGLQKNEAVSLTALFGSDTALHVSDDSTSAYLFGANLSELKYPGTYSKSLAGLPASSMLQYDTQSGIFTVTSPGTEAGQAVQLAAAQLKQDGFDPNLYGIQYSSEGSD